MEVLNQRPRWASQLLPGPGGASIYFQLSNEVNVNQLKKLAILATFINVGCTTMAKNKAVERQPSNDRSSVSDGINHNPKTSCDGMNDLIEAAGGNELRKNSTTARCYVGAESWRIMGRFLSSLSREKVGPINYRGAPWKYHDFEGAFAAGWSVRLVMITWSRNLPFKITVLMSPGNVNEFMSGSFQVQEDDGKGYFDFLI